MEWIFKIIITSEVTVEVVEGRTPVNVKHNVIQKTTNLFSVHAVIMYSGIITIRSWPEVKY